VLKVPVNSNQSIITALPQAPWLDLRRPTSKGWEGKEREEKGLSPRKKFLAPPLAAGTGHDKPELYCYSAEAGMTLVPASASTMFR